VPPPAGRSLLRWATCGGGGREGGAPEPASPPRVGIGCPASWAQLRANQRVRRALLRAVGGAVGLTTPGVCGRPRPLRFLHPGPSVRGCCCYLPSITRRPSDVLGNKESLLGPDDLLHPLQPRGPATCLSYPTFPQAVPPTPPHPCPAFAPELLRGFFQNLCTSSLLWAALSCLSTPLTFSSLSPYQAEGLECSRHLTPVCGYEPRKRMTA
jgi:hypothetical protein